MRITTLILWCALTLSAQTGKVREANFEGRPAMALDNGKLTLTVLLQGGSLASVVLDADNAKLNPLWEPTRMARELGGSPRISGGTGHFVCVDGFGPTSPDERAAGLEGHGEAHRQNFEVVGSGQQGRDAYLTIRASLPIVQENFTRTIRMAEGENVIAVESELENLLGFDRPVNWAEHATVGSPFLEPGMTVVDLSGSRSKARPYESGRNGQLQRRLKSGDEFAWPNAPGLDGGPVDLRLTPTRLGYLDHAATLIDSAQRLGWVTVLHPGKRLLIGYLFRRDEYPWLQYWGNYPANGKLARGLEFSAQPFDVPRREAISMGSLFGAPTYRWLPAKAKIASKFLMFYAEAPAGFRKVDSVRLENGQIVIEDRTAHREIKLTTSASL